MLFTAFNTIDRSAATLFAVDEPTRGTNSVAIIPDESRDMRLLNALTPTFTKRYVTSQVAFRKTTRDGGSITTVSTRVGGYATTRRPRSMQDLVAMQRPIESTIITYPQFIRASVSEPENYPMPTRPIAVNEKRSFLSKTASVIKKPYTWIKALGSKLN